MEPTVEQLRTLDRNPTVIALAMVLQKRLWIVPEADGATKETTRQHAIVMATGAVIRVLCLEGRQVDQHTIDWISGIIGLGSACDEIGFLQDGRLRFDWLFGVEAVDATL